MENIRKIKLLTLEEKKYLDDKYTFYKDKQENTVYIKTKIRHRVRKMNIDDYKYIDLRILGMIRKRLKLDKFVLEAYLKFYKKDDNLAILQNAYNTLLVYDLKTTYNALNIEYKKQLKEFKNFLEKLKEEKDYEEN